MDQKNEIVKKDDVSFIAPVTSNDETAMYDIQISTARRFPRDLERVAEGCKKIILLDKEIAKSCSYALPRDGKNIEGPSVHLARIVAQQYGNMRAEAKVKSVEDKWIVAEAIAWDLESNFAVKKEVRRRITNKMGQRFSDDMIIVTGNAASAIAFRNAVFDVVPRGIITTLKEIADKLIDNELSEPERLKKNVLEAFNFFSKYKVAEDHILNKLGRGHVDLVTREDVKTLFGYKTAITEGDSSAAEIFGLKSETKTDAGRKTVEDIIAKTNQQSDSKK